ncbi:hypothetical protein L1049_016653 [Liquidambar formosana]|uniref:COP9 signalosome complex subunit 3 n=1 Tax=Liquidambar formosana TaxID=63359 RepID=A0AAP0X0R3_LIQFO
MDSVEAVVAQIQGLSSNGADIQHLHNQLKQAEERLHSQSTQLSSFHDQLDPSKHSLGYLYILGMICIGQERFRKALELLHNVVTASMSIINTIAVEAYKKYILVSLIHHGHFSTSLPKYTSSVAQRNLKSYCQQVYIELANSYSTGKISELEACVLANRERFEIRLTQTYLALSLQDIANTVQLNSPKEAEMHVLQMIQDGEIFATINQKDGMVRFLEDPEQYKSCEMIEHIDSSIQRIMGLSKKLTAIDEHISSDALYLAKVGRERQQFDFDDFDTVPQKFNI